MLLCEDGEVRPASVHYAIELAIRLKASLWVLMLASNKRLLGAWEERLQPYRQRLQEQGVLARTVVRYGDKTSELLKFLATLTQPASIVWSAGAQNSPRSHTSKTGHWLAKVARRIACPIVSPKQRQKDESHRQKDES